MANKQYSVTLKDGTKFMLRSDGHGPICLTCGYQATTHDRGPVDGHLAATGEECSLCHEDRTSINTQPRVL